MKVHVLLGLQWGDEGKGKVVDVLTPRYDEFYIKEIVENDECLINLYDLVLCQDLVQVKMRFSSS